MRRQRHSLNRRILWVASLPAVLIVVSLTSLLYIKGSEVLDRVSYERALSIVSFMAPASEYGVLTGNRATLDALLHSVLATRGVRAAAVLDAETHILAQSGRLTGVPDQEVRGWGQPGVLHDARDTLTVVAPVELAPLSLELGGEDSPTPPVPRLIGWVYIEFDTEARRERKQEILLLALGVASFGLLLTGILARQLARSVSEPVERLVEGVRRMASGERHVRVKPRASSLEIAALERGFNRMADAIATHEEQLQARIDEATHQLAWQANHDPLTGLCNRRRFEEALDSLLSRTRRESDQSVLCFVDLDRFKIVNDTCGHPAGDALLREIARILQGRVREEDLVCRVGGDEFALLLHGCALDNARRIAEALRQAVADYRFSCDGRTFSIGASIGLVPIGEQEVSPSDVLIAADMACYAAKKAGRNQIVERLPGSPDAEPAEEALLPLAEAIDTERLLLHAQPIVDAQGLPCLWWEILLRYRDEAGVAQAPARMLAASERDGVGLALDLWVAERACEALRERDASGQGRVSLNLGRASIIEASRYFEQLDALCRRYERSPASLVLELGMAQVEELPAETRRFVELARQYGHALVLEHFDAGGLTRMGAVRPDYIKLGLVRLIDALGQEQAMALVGAIGALAHALRMRVIVAEVETPLMHRALEAMDIDYMQGEGLVAPAPLREMLAG